MGEVFAPQWDEKGQKTKYRVYACIIIAQGVKSNHKPSCNLMLTDRFTVNRLFCHPDQASMCK